MAELILKRIHSFGEYRRAGMVEIRANIAYLCGHQNIQVQQGHIVPLPETYRTPIVANKILPAVVNDMAVASKTPPRYDVIPDTTDETDKATAKAGDRIIKYLQKVNGRDLGRKGAVLWYDIAGTGWRKIYWNPYFEIQGYNPQPDQEGFNPNMEPGQPVFRGEVVIDNVPNSELIFDHRCKDLKKLQWIIHAKTITVGEIKSRYGKDALQGVGPNCIKDGYNGLNEFEVEILGDFAQLSANITNAINSPGVTPGFEDDKTANYYEFWHVPSVTMPMGAYVVMVGNKVIINQPYPIQSYPHQRLPFVPAVPIQLVGINPRAISRITQARPLQREYNRLRSIVADNIDAMGNSVFMAPKDCNIEVKRLSNSAGNVVEFDGPMKPSREPGVPIPGSFFGYIAEVKQSIDEAFSFPEPARGFSPTGGPDSAKGLQLLQDASHTQLGPMVDGFDEADEEVVFQALSLAIANYGERVLPILGDDNAWVHYHLNPEELNGRFTVSVRTGSSLPLNKALEAEKAFLLWQSGLLGDPNSPELRLQTLKQMDAGNLDAVLQRNSKQINFAQKEFAVAEQQAMQVPPLPPTLTPDEQLAIIEEFLYVPHPNAFDDHTVHIEEHGNWIMDKYWKYKASGLTHMEILAQALMAHCEEHKMILQQQQMMATQQQTLAEAFVRGNTLEQIMLKKKSNEDKAKTKPAGSNKSTKE
ncbi:MAG: hypothetical protein LLF76_02780 [Planctomycetaceae bacterium]|nr:hypothetical protein [Planctomycetaceae bacterium]